MKKRLIISLILFVSCVLAFVFIIMNKKDDASYEESGTGSYFSCYRKIVFPEEYPIAGQFDVSDATFDTIKITVTLDKGSVWFEVYDWNSMDIEKAYDIKLSETEITESGTYEYNMDYLPEGTYWIVVKQNDENTEAVVEVLEENSIE